ncbi:MAG: hypothetical protein ABIK28_12375 [Planctomycetota bacterium]
MKNSLIDFVAVCALALMLTLLFPDSAMAQDQRGPSCLTPLLPRPTEDVETVRARFNDRTRTPPPDPQVGDSWDWWIWDLGGYPTATKMPCTVRGMGDNIYIVVEDGQWNVNIDQADVDRIVDHFENVSLGNFPTQGIWDLNTSHFGYPPNSDGLDRIFFLYYEFGISSDGFFWYFDQYPDGSQPFHSNEADVIYLATDSGTPASDYMMAVGAHEFEHMIHFDTDSNEDSWVDEGMGELAMWLFGHPDSISGFNTNPDNSLVDFSGAWGDYIQTYLWTLYAYEQFGGQPFIWEVCHQKQNGMNGYQLSMTNLGFSTTTQNTFGNWSAANFLDEPDIYAGQYGYLGDTLPAFTSFRTHTTYPVINSSGSVKAWATDYARLLSLNPGVPVITFNGNDTHAFRVKILGIDAVRPTIVKDMVLNAANDGYFDGFMFVGYDQVEISIASVTTTGTGSYTYSVEVHPMTGPDPAGRIMESKKPSF